MEVGVTPTPDRRSRKVGVATISVMCLLRTLAMDAGRLAGA